MSSVSSYRIKVFIKENSLIAKLAARKLSVTRVAIVIGRTIYLWNMQKDVFLKSPAWLRHELTHVMQFKEYGFIRFICLYLYECMKKGYINNRFEKEARSKENKPLPEHIHFDIK